MTIYRKVPVSERLPEMGGCYDTDLGSLVFNNSYKWWVDNNGDSVYPEWYLEEIELPNRDEVAEYADKHSNNFEGVAGQMANAAENNGIIVGAKYILNKITNNK